MKLSYFDVVDDTDTLTGSQASYDQVHDQGLWHRGVHVLIYTPDRQIVMQKRSLSLKYHPNEVEVSVGGGVDAGERPDQAAAREMYEELGVSVNPDQLHFIGKTKFNHATKTQIYRTFIYSYSICLTADKLIFKLDPEETSTAFLLSEKKLRRALRRHRIRKIGKITSTYAYWRYLLDSIA